MCEAKYQVDFHSDTDLPKLVADRFDTVPRAITVFEHGVVLVFGERVGYTCPCLWWTCYQISL